jgi:hypothetical protein
MHDVTFGIVSLIVIENIVVKFECKCRYFF